MLEALFNPDNAFMCFINKIIDLVVLSLVWIVCCIPIITIGPACSALYYAVVKAVRRKRSYPVKEFLRAFKSNLMKGMIIEIVLVAFVCMMLYVDAPLVLVLLDTGKIQNVLFLVLFAIKAVILLGGACWIFPLLSRFEEKIWKLAHASMYLLLRYIPVTLLAILLILVTVWLLVCEPLLLAILPGTMTLVLSFILEPVMRRICERKELDNNERDTWYLEK